MENLNTNCVVMRARGRERLSEKENITTKFTVEWFINGKFVSRETKTKKEEEEKRIRKIYLIVVIPI